MKNAFSPLRLRLAMLRVPSSMMLMAAMLLAGCQDAPPTEYLPQYVVEAYLIVDRPIEGINVTLTQPTTAPYQYPTSAVTDAEVDILVDGRRLRLQYRSDTKVGTYYYPDTLELVRPSTTYAIEVRTKDGALLTGHTTTPTRIEWTRAPKETIVYPGSDTARAHDSLTVSWTGIPGAEAYMLCVKALDTLDYGRYLAPPTGEPNERIFRGDPRRGLRSTETARWSLLPQTSVPMVWTTFKWYGLHDITVYAPDPNFLDWYRQINSGRTDEYDYRLGSIEGGIGVFGSAAVATQRVMLVKPE